VERDDLIHPKRALEELRHEFPEAVYIDVADEARLGNVTLTRTEQGHRRIARSEIPRLRQALAKRFGRSAPTDGGTA